MSPSAAARARYLRPIKAAIALSMVSEGIILVVWGFILYPEGSWLYKILWTLGFCGLGMGATTGALIDLLVVDRFDGVRAVVACAALATFTLGVGCNVLCLSLDRHFLYFGGGDDAALFIGNGLVMAALGGAAVGSLCFTRAGRALFPDV